MKLSLKNIWITINILLAICMVVSVITKGFTNITFLFIALTNFSALAYFFVFRSK